MKKILFFLLFLTSFTAYNQSIIGGGGRCLTDANPNTVTALSSGFSNLGYCTEVFDTVNNIHYSLNRAGTIGTDKWVVDATLKNAWSLTGNATTDPTINFLGTTDAQDLVFRRNNLVAGYLSGTTVTVFGQNNAVRTALTGINNTFIGIENFIGGTTAANNAAVGYANFRSATTHAFNTAVGTENFKVTTASQNTAVGYRNFFLNTTGSLNTAVGFQNFRTCLTVQHNNALGYQNFQNVTTGSNTGIGNQNFNLASTGGQNIGIGSLNANAGVVTGSRNVLLGVENAGTITTATNNNAIGYRNMVVATTAMRNNVMGNGNLGVLVNGTNNTAIGDNIFPLLLVTGTDNTGIGSGISVSGDYSNTSGLGANVAITQSNQVVLGGTNATQVKFRGEAGYNYAHNVSSTLTSLDDRKVWTYDHANTSISMQSLAASSALNTALTIPVITAFNTGTVTATATGAVVGDRVVVNPRTALSNGLIIAYSRVTAANTVEIGFVAATAFAGGSVNFDISTYR